MEIDPLWSNVGHWAVLAGSRVTFPYSLSIIFISISIVIVHAPVCFRKVPEYCIILQSMESKAV